MRRHNYLTIFKYVFALCVIVYLWQTGLLDLQAIKKSLSGKASIYLIFILFVALGFNFLRFYLIIKTQRLVENVVIAWKVFWTGLFFNFLMPGGTGGDLIKGVYLVKENPNRKAELVTAIVYDRFVGLFTMVAMALTAMLMRTQVLNEQRDLKVLFFFMATLWLGFLFFTSLMLIERGRFKNGKNSILKAIIIWDWQKKVHEAVLKVFELKVFLLAVVFTLICQVLIIFFFIVAANSSGVESNDPVIYFVVAPIGFILMAIPLAPGGIGIGQVAFAALYKYYSGSGTTAIVTSVSVYQILTFCLSFLGLYYYLVGWDSSISRSTTPANG